MSTTTDLSDLSDRTRRRLEREVRRRGGTVDDLVARALTVLRQVEAGRQLRAEPTADDRAWLEADLS